MVNRANSQVVYTNKRGVTLVEVLSTFVVIGVLTAIIAPVYINTLDSAHRVKCANQLSLIGSAVLAYEAEHGALPGPLYPYEGWEFTLRGRLASAGYLLNDDLWVCPANDGVKGESVLAEESTYVVNNTPDTLPPYFFGLRDGSAPQALTRISLENPDGVWLLRDHDVFEPGGFVFDPIGSPGISDQQRPPHAKGRNYFFTDGHVRHIKFGAFPVE